MSSNKHRDTKIVYFVRHGESEANVGITTDIDSPLTARGEEQAHYMARRASKIKLDVVLASTLQRARQTAEIIAHHIGTEVADTSDLFVECRRASVHHDKSEHHPDSRKTDEEIFQNFSKPGYRHSDEENFDDLKKRAGEAWAYIESRPEKHILVVSHGHFLRVLTAYATFGPDLTAHECQRIMRVFHTENTGVTVFRHDTDRPQPWWLWIWNDHAHLADA